MLIHKLIAHHLKHGSDASFYRLQAIEAINWLEKSGVNFRAQSRVLDLGCGSGVFGEELLRRGCEVLFADDQNWLPPSIPKDSFRRIDLEREDVSQLGKHDLIVCSNVIEHLAHPERLIARFGRLLRPDGNVYLSWTNWLSPWGGHDFSPFHYFGPRLGPKLFDRLVRRPRLLKPYENLFPTYIGRTLRQIRVQPDLRILRMAPRYYTELAFLMRIPLLREFAVWNSAVLIAKT